MRVRLELTGGLAFLPGLHRPIVVDSENLGAQDRADLERLLQSSAFFSLPARLGVDQPGAADQRHYKLTIEDAGRRHSVSFSDPVGNEALVALRGFVRRLGARS